MQSFLSITKPEQTDNYGPIIPTSPRSSPLTLSAVQHDSPMSNDSSNDVKRLLNEVSISLIQLIETNINLPSFELTNSEKTWIKLLIVNSPNSFAHLDSFLNTILSSGNLSVVNIPELVQLFANEFNSISLELNIANSHNVYVLIKFIIDILIDISPLTQMEVRMIKCVVDTSLSLLFTVLADSSSQQEEAKQDVFSPEQVKPEQEPKVSVLDISGNEIRPIEPITYSAEVVIPEVTSNKCYTFFKFFGK